MNPDLGIVDPGNLTAKIGKSLRMVIHPVSTFKYTLKCLDFEKQSLNFFLCPENFLRMGKKINKKADNSF